MGGETAAPEELPFSPQQERMGQTSNMILMKTDIFPNMILNILEKINTLLTFNENNPGKNSNNPAFL